MDAVDVCLCAMDTSTACPLLGPATFFRHMALGLRFRSLSGRIITVPLCVRRRKEGGDCRCNVIDVPDGLVFYA